MNTDFDVFTPEMVEFYFQRSLFYGVFPSMFSHDAPGNTYWNNPNWYIRHRGLSKRYQPIIKRVAEAGWQPVTYATSSNPKILVERFGPGTKATNHFTVLLVQKPTRRPEDQKIQAKKGLTVFTVLA